MGSSYERLLGQREGQMLSICVLLKEPVDLLREDIEKALIVSEISTDTWMETNPVSYALRRAGLDCKKAGPLQIVVGDTTYFPTTEMNQLLRRWRDIVFEDERRTIRPMKNLAAPIVPRGIGFH